MLRFLKLSRKVLGKLNEHGKFSYLDELYTCDGHCYRGQPLEANWFHISIGKRVITKMGNPPAALAVWFDSFMFKLQYPPKAAVPCKFVQRCFFGINPHTGSKCLEHRWEGEPYSAWSSLGDLAFDYLSTTLAQLMSSDEIKEFRKHFNISDAKLNQNSDSDEEELKKTNVKKILTILKKKGILYPNKANSLKALFDNFGSLTTSKLPWPIRLYQKCASTYVDLPQQQQSTVNAGLFNDLFLVSPSREIPVERFPAQNNWHNLNVINVVNTMYGLVCYLQSGKIRGTNVLIQLFTVPISDSNDYPHLIYSREISRQGYKESLLAFIDGAHLVMAYNETLEIIDISSKEVVRGCQLHATAKSMAVEEGNIFVIVGDSSEVLVFSPGLEEITKLIFNLEGWKYPVDMKVTPERLFIICKVRSRDHEEPYNWQDRAMSFRREDGNMEANYTFPGQRLTQPVSIAAHVESNFVVVLWSQKQKSSGRCSEITSTVSLHALSGCCVFLLDMMHSHRIQILNKNTMIVINQNYGLTYYNMAHFFEVGKVRASLLWSPVEAYFKVSSNFSDIQQESFKAGPFFQDHVFVTQGGRDDDVHVNHVEEEVHLESVHQGEDHPQGKDCTPLQPQQQHNQQLQQLASQQYQRLDQEHGAALQLEQVAQQQHVILRQQAQQHTGQRVLKQFPFQQNQLYQQHWQQNQEYEEQLQALPEQLDGNQTHQNQKPRRYSLDQLQAPLAQNHPCRPLFNNSSQINPQQLSAVNNQQQIVFYTQQQVAYNEQIYSQLPGESAFVQYQQQHQAALLYQQQKHEQQVQQQELQQYSSYQAQTLYQHQAAAPSDDQFEKVPFAEQMTGRHKPISSRFYHHHQQELPFEVDAGPVPVLKSSAVRGEICPQPKGFIPLQPQQQHNQQLKQQATKRKQRHGQESPAALQEEQVPQQQYAVTLRQQAQKPADQHNLKQQFQQHQHYRQQWQHNPTKKEQLQAYSKKLDGNQRHQNQQPFRYSLPPGCNQLQAPFAKSPPFQTVFNKSGRLNLQQLSPVHSHEQTASFNQQETAYNGQIYSQAGGSAFAQHQLQHQAALPYQPQNHQQQVQQLELQQYPAYQARSSFHNQEAAFSHNKFGQPSVAEQMTGILGPSVPSFFHHHQQDVRFEAEAGSVTKLGGSPVRGGNYPKPRRFTPLQLQQQNNQLQQQATQQVQGYNQNPAAILQQEKVAQRQHAVTLEPQSQQPADHQALRHQSLLHQHQLPQQQWQHKRVYQEQLQVRQEVLGYNQIQKYQQPLRYSQPPGYNQLHAQKPPFQQFSNKYSRFHLQQLSAVHNQKQTVLYNQQQAAYLAPIYRQAPGESAFVQHQHQQGVVLLYQPQNHEQQAQQQVLKQYQAYQARTSIQHQITAPFCDEIGQHPFSGQMTGSQETNSSSNSNHHQQELQYEPEAGPVSVLEGSTVRGVSHPKPRRFRPLQSQQQQHQQLKQPAIQQTQRHDQDHAVALQKEQVAHQQHIVTSRQQTQQHAYKQNLDQQYLFQHHEFYQQHSKPSQTYKEQLQVHPEQQVRNHLQQYRPPVCNSQLPGCNQLQAPFGHKPIRQQLYNDSSKFNLQQLSSVHNQQQTVSYNHQQVALNEQIYSQPGGSAFVQHQAELPYQPQNRQQQVQQLELEQYPANQAQSSFQYQTAASSHNKFGQPSVTEQMTGRLGPAVPSYYHHQQQELRYGAGARHVPELEGSPERDKRSLFVECLKKKIRSMSETKVFTPWEKSFRWKSTDLFVSCWLILNDKISNGIVKNIKDQRKLKYTEIFTHQRLKSETQIIIEGGPGTGKTTLLAQLAFDWFRGKTENVDILIFLPLKIVQDKTLIQAVKEFYIPENAPLTGNDIENILSNKSEKICLLLDGLEKHRTEGSIGSKESSDLRSVLKKEKLSCCKVVVTCRSYRSHDLSDGSLLKIGGFGETERRSFIKKLSLDNIEKQQKIKQVIEDPSFLQSLCSVPLLFASAVHNIESLGFTEASQFDKVAPFVKNIVETLCLSTISGHETWSTQEQLILGELAFNGTCRGQQHFSWPKDIIEGKVIHFRHWIDSGILVEETNSEDTEVAQVQDQPYKDGRQEREERSSETAVVVKFLHKVIHEWFAATFLCSMMSHLKDEDEFHEYIRRQLERINPEEFRYLLRFTCYLHPPSCHAIMNFLLTNFPDEDDHVLSHIMDCICLCFAEHNDIKGLDMKNTVTEVCTEVMIIDAQDGRFLQQAKSSLLQYASDRGVIIKEIRLANVIFAVDEKFLTLTSGTKLKPFDTLQVIKVSQLDDVLLQDDFENILKLLSKGNYIEKILCIFPSQPPKLLDDEIIQNAFSKNLEVNWHHGKFILTLDVKRRSFLPSSGTRTKARNIELKTKKDFFMSHEDVPMSLPGTSTSTFDKRPRKRPSSKILHCDVKPKETGKQPKITFLEGSEGGVSLHSIQDHVKSLKADSQNLIIELLSRKLTKEWKGVCRCLGVEDSVVFQIEEDNKGNVKEIIFKCLLHWKQSSGGKETLETLNNALAKCGRSDLPKELNKVYEELSPRHKTTP